MNTKAMVVVLALLGMAVGTAAEGLVRSGPVCPGDTTGYLCDAGNKKQYYECNSPWFVGWRDCPTGTVCTDTSKLHNKIPCYVYDQEDPGTTGPASDYRGGEAAESPSTAAPPAEQNWEAQVGVLKSWGTWWLWVALAAYVLVALIVGWIGCVTWPNTHKRLALATHRCIC